MGEDLEESRMTVTFYTNTSDNRALSKSITQLKSVTATVKGECDILNPELEVSYFSEVSGANYMYISEWNRYYFIDRISLTHGQRAIIHGHVDVLSTYKDDILDCAAVVCRQQSKGNYYLNDPVYKTRQYKITTVQEFPNEKFTRDGSLILAVAGSESEVTP